MLESENNFLYLMKYCTFPSHNPHPTSTALRKQYEGLPTFWTLNQKGITFHFFLSLSFGCWPKSKDTLMLPSLSCSPLGSCIWPPFRLKRQNFSHLSFNCLLQITAEIHSYPALSVFLLNSNKLFFSFCLHPFLNSFINETKNLNKVP